ncbi:MAG: hypothetical protein WBA41_02710 [Rivularia sp. (in: cyanobacteria)]
MTRFLYDQFAKDYLEELLQPLGKIETSKKVPAEIREIDVYFAPSSQPSTDAIQLGLLGKIADKPALIEPFRGAVKISEIRSCMNKLFYIIADAERQNKRDNTFIKEDDLPKLWILSPTVSTTILDGFKASLDEENWGAGVYFLGDYLKTVIIAIHQLPRTDETLWLRLLGKGRVQQKAVEELETLPQNNPLRNKAIDLLLSLKTQIEVKQNPDEEDREALMGLSPIYLQRLADARQEGQRTVIENLLRARFGTLDDELKEIIQPLLGLTPEEFSPLLIQLSREELLSRFRQE